jgi:hypothetical protein
MTEPTRESNPLRSSAGSWDFRLAAGVDVALVLFLFVGSFSGFLSGDAALKLVDSILLYTTGLVGWRTGLKGTAIVKGPATAPIVPGAPRG